MCQPVKELVSLSSPLELATKELLRVPKPQFCRNESDLFEKRVKYNEERPAYGQEYTIAESLQVYSKDGKFSCREILK